MASFVSRLRGKPNVEILREPKAGRGSESLIWTRNASSSHVPTYHRPPGVLFKLTLPPHLQPEYGVAPREATAVGASEFFLVFDGVMLLVGFAVPARNRRSSGIVTAVRNYLVREVVELAPEIPLLELKRPLFRPEMTFYAKAPDGTAALFGLEQSTAQVTPMDVTWTPYDGRVLVATPPEKLDNPGAWILHVYRDAAIPALAYLLVLAREEEMEHRREAMMDGFRDLVDSYLAWVDSSALARAASPRRRATLRSGAAAIHRAHADQSVASAEVVSAIDGLQIFFDQSVLLSEAYEHLAQGLEPEEPDTSGVMAALGQIQSSTDGDVALHATVWSALVAAVVGALVAGVVAWATSGAPSETALPSDLPAPSPAGDVVDEPLDDNPPE